MIPRFFIYHPIFATVVSIVIVIAGGVCLLVLPIAQYPDITPPTVSVICTYPGANAQVVSDTVAAPIEQQVNGVSGMLYMSSVCGSDGSYTLTVTFEVGTNVDMATVLVQNRVQAALAMLPDEVKRTGVITQKKSSSMVLAVNLISPNGERDDLYLANYATSRLVDEIKRLPGVGDVVTFPTKDYAMRVWLDPDKLKARGLTTNDVAAAIRSQNAQVAAGQIGRPPAPAGQKFQLTISTLGRLSTADQFADIIVKTAANGAITRVGDVARVEMGAKVYDNYATLDGQPAALMLVYQTPEANALNVSEAVRAKMAELFAKDPPSGVKYLIPFDTTAFVKQSIDEVVKTLFEAFVLVFIVIFVFLQDWRATLIPALTIPVALIGTFAVMAVLGFSINMLTLFGLVLAIGIVVDDAIVVVENVARNMEEHGLKGREAATKAMEEVSGPIIGITLVLMSVFVPSAFMPGMTGQLYKQFALTIAVSTAFSAINALSLSPALCAIFLKPGHAKKKNVFFRGFDWVFDRCTAGYTRVVQICVRRIAILMLLFGGLGVLTVWQQRVLPTGFLPTEDQGYAMLNVQLPQGASLERTQKVMDRVAEVLKTTPGIGSYMVIGGYSILDSNSAPNAAAGWLVYKPWSERESEAESQEGIVAHLRKELSTVQDAQIMVFVPPAIQGLGNSGGFQFQLQDRGVGLPTLEKVAWDFVLEGNASTDLTSVFTTFSARAPQLYADVDREKAELLGVRVEDVNATLQTYLGSSYVNDFNQLGKTYQVNLQAEARFRATAADVDRLEVRNKDGQMVPLGTLVKMRDTIGPQSITRYNMYPAATITGEAAAGYSSGQAIQAMETMAGKLMPANMGYEWTGVTYQELKAGNAAPLIFGLAVVLVFLVLAAQYESWSNPFAVIMVVPLAMLGAFLASAMRGMDVNIYTQVGLVLLVGLAAKNAILIVEFAREERAKGKDLRTAAIDSARLRFRPILMTSFAFILGVVPLVIADGAGAASRQAMGTAVFGGMITGTALAVIFVPVFYVLCQGAGEWIGRLLGKAPPTGHGTDGHAPAQPTPSEPTPGE